MHLNFDGQVLERSAGSKRTQCLGIESLVAAAESELDSECADEVAVGGFDNPEEVEQQVWAVEAERLELVEEVASNNVDCSGSQTQHYFF